MDVYPEPPLVIFIEVILPRLSIVVVAVALFLSAVMLAPPLLINNVGALG